MDVKKEAKMLVNKPCFRQKRGGILEKKAKETGIRRRPEKIIFGRRDDDKEDTKDDQRKNNKEKKLSVWCSLTIHQDPNLEKRSKNKMTCWQRLSGLQPLDL